MVCKILILCNIKRPYECYDYDMDLPYNNCLCKIQIRNELSYFPYWSLQVHPPPKHKVFQQTSTFHNIGTN